MKSARPNPISTFSNLEDSYRKGRIPSLVFVTGPAKGAAENFFAQALERLFKERLEREKGIEVFAHDAEDSENFQLQLLCDDLQSPPLFGEKKAILIRRGDSLCRRNSKAGKEPTAFESALMRFLDSKAKGKTGPVLCLLENLSPLAPLIAAGVEKGAVHLEARKLYVSPPPWASGGSAMTEVARWTADRAGRKGLRLSARQIQQVANRRGDDLSGIEKDLEQMALGGTAARSMEEPEDSIAAQSQFPGFAPLLDAIFRKELPEIMTLLSSLFQTGFRSWSGEKVEDPRALFAIFNSVLAGEIRKLLQAAETPQRSRSWSGAELTQMFSELLQLDRDFKQGRLQNVQAALELLFLRSCLRGTKEAI